jgi:EF hand domain-containing protein
MLSSGRMTLMRVFWRPTATLFCLILLGCQDLGHKSAPAMTPGRMAYINEFKRIDTANKGSITIDQASQYYAALFKRLDVRRDGLLDAKELEAALPMINASSSDELVLKLDRNGDNKVSLAEFLVAANWLFQLSSTGDTLSLEDVQRNAPATVLPSVKKETGGPGSEKSKF